MNRKLLLAGLAVVMLCCQGVWAQDAAKKLNVAVVTGGHGFDETEFWDVFKQNTAITFTPLSEKEVFEDISNWPYDVLVLYNMSGKISEECQKNFLALLDKGVGLVLLHHAIANYPDWPEYRKILGAKYFLKETEENGVKHPTSEYTHDVDFNIHVADANHPITQGLSDFTIHDEVYRKWLLDPGNQVLLTTDHPQSAKEICWGRDYAKSKVCFFQLGHDKQAYANPNFREVLARAIQWTAGKLLAATK